MANPRVRALIRRRKWGKRDWAITAAGFTFILLALGLTLLFDSRDPRGRTPPTFDHHRHSTQGLVPLTLLHRAKATGAFCLDGSLPGYHFQKGSESGSNNWLLHIDGGGWCSSIKTCNIRKRTALGSSKYMNRLVPFAGILSRHPSENPDFYNWNIVKIRYCDGASFAGHPESEFKNGTKLFFRGQLIWEAIMSELLSLGLSKVKQALLSGCSAGGLATLIHCDEFRDHLPRDATVKCLADAGFFLDEPDILGNSTISDFYHDVVQLQGVAKSLSKKCVRTMEPSKCMFPQEIIKNVRTPLFIVNPAYDFWQIQHVLVPVGSDPHGYWRRCRLNIKECDSSQIKTLQGFRTSMLKALSKVEKDKEGGMFINSCFVHCQTWMAETWHSPDSPRINNKTIAESVGDWYFKRKPWKEIDCPYPCNPTCHNMITRVAVANACSPATATPNTHQFSSKRPFTNLFTRPNVRFAAVIFSDFWKTPVCLPNLSWGLQRQTERKQSCQQRIDWLLLTFQGSLGFIYVSNSNMIFHAYDQSHL